MKCFMSGGHREGLKCTSLYQRLLIWWIRYLESRTFASAMKKIDGVYGGRTGRELLLWQTHSTVGSHYSCWTGVQWIWCVYHRDTVICHSSRNSTASSFQFITESTLPMHAHKGFRWIYTLRMHVYDCGMQRKPAMWRKEEIVFHVQDAILASVVFYQGKWRKRIARAHSIFIKRASVLKEYDAKGQIVKFLLLSLCLWVGWHFESVALAFLTI